MSSSGVGAPPLDQSGEVAHQIGDRTRRLQRVALRVGRDDRLGPAVELRSVLVGDTEVVGDDHARQRLEQFGHHIALAGLPQSFDALHHERPDRTARRR